jgi:hypothetical protein
MTHSIDDSWTYAFQHDFGNTESAYGDPSAQWYSVNNYLMYAINDDLDAGIRLEWFRDADGARVAGLRSGAGGVDAHYYAVTLGLNYRLVENFLLRPEIRYDYQDADNGAAGAFNGGADDDQLLAAMNAILQF